MLLQLVTQRREELEQQDRFMLCTPKHKDTISMLRVMEKELERGINTPGNPFQLDCGNLVFDITVNKVYE